MAWLGWLSRALSDLVSGPFFFLPSVVVLGLNLKFFCRRVSILPLTELHTASASPIAFKL